MEKIAKKVARLLELSGKFTKSFDEIFPNEDNHRGLVTCGSFTSADNGYHINNGKSNTLMVTGHLVLNGREIYVDDNGDVRSKDNKPFTRADEIRAKAEIKAKISDEFDEYNKLRNELSNYFSALNKVIE